MPIGSAALIAVELNNGNFGLTMIGFLIGTFGMFCAGYYFHKEMS